MNASGRWYWTLVLMLLGVVWIAGCAMTGDGGMGGGGMDGGIGHQH